MNHEIQYDYHGLFKCIHINNIMKTINHQGAFPYITKTLKKAKTESPKGLQTQMKVSYVELGID